MDASGEVAATSFSGTRWSKCSGQAAPDGSSLWLAFHPTDNETGIVANNCSTIIWPGAVPSVWGKAGPYHYGPASGVVVTEVHMVWMAHLDLGYTDLARNVCDYYFSENLPGNIALAAATANSATPFALTTHPFLVAEYLDGAAGCAHNSSRPNATAIAAMEAAIRAGWIHWHAQSANYLPELLDPAAFATMVGESARLNAKYGTNWGSLLMKSTDLPGLSRSVIPNLAALGRKAIQTAGNAKVQLAHVPQAFTWAHPESGTSVLALATNDYGGTLVVPPHALIINYQGDNSDAPSAAQVAANYASAASAFPNATVHMSSFEAFVEAALSSTPGAAALPVISSEMGDSWLYGAPSDPYKMAVFRETRRTIADAVAGTLPGQSQPLSLNDTNLLAFERRILVGGPEHNGGVSIGAYLPQSRGDTGNWSNGLFHSVYSTSSYQLVQSSYDEKVMLTSTALPPVAPVSDAWTTFLAARDSRVAGLTPQQPDLGPGSGYMPVSNPGALITCGRLQVTFNTTDGSLASLIDIATGHEWAASPAVLGPDAPGLLGFSYRTYDEADFNSFNSEYTPACGVPCPNFAKVGLDSASPSSRLWRPALSGVWVKTATAVAGRGKANEADSTGADGDGESAASAPQCSIYASLSLPGPTVALYGGMASVWLRLDVDTDSTSPAPMIDATLTWFNKTLTRMAESSWISFTPNVNVSSQAQLARQAVVSNPANAADLWAEGATSAAASANTCAWWLDVLGWAVDPLDVVVYGTRHVHAVNSGFGYGAGVPNGVCTASAQTGQQPPCTDDSCNRHGASGTASTVTAFAVQTLDAFLVSPGDTAHLLHYDGNRLPDMTGGFHVNLHNNLWGTSFPQWWAGDAAFRFTVTLQV